MGDGDMSNASADWGRELYEETIAGLRGYLRSQCKLSRSLREYLDHRETPLLKHPNHTLDAVQIRAYQALLRSLEISSSSILKLTQKTNEHIRDCYSIARSVVETSINLAFIAAGGLPAAEEARKHSLRRSYQDLDKKLVSGTLIARIPATALDDPKRHEEMLSTLKALEVDITVKRKEWTPLSVPKRLESLSIKLGDDVTSLLVHSYLLIYQDASEVLHGSVYGCFLWRGLTTDQEVALQDSAFKVLFATGVSFNRGMAAIGRAHEMRDVQDAADRFDLLMAKVPVFGKNVG